ncbi:hypothetical protein PV327_010324 [Microctonus hyperodae]|uniref:FACT complex subunit SSRP1 n=1 Tax=Microctonus hyperodae TaxID=165561 RepID=A0AA39KUT4_MICHY|nr:hypothetical protein PV327_010324 [Microctonus hyperodae]
MDFLEFPHISAEIKGAMTPGRLKLTDQNIIFKNQKTGKVEQISANDLEMVNFQKFPETWGLRLFLLNGMLHRFRGFKESEREKVAKFFSSNYNKDMLEKELSLKGWNWGAAKFNGSVLNFDVGNHTAFEIPLQNVSQSTTAKNEVALEFHQNDDTPVSLLEMRFHIPVSDSAEQDPIEAFHQRVMEKASVISVSGDAIAIFREVQCLTPRVLRLFLLPHKDSRQMFFVVSLDPPIKQGQTRYHYLVLLFNQEEETSIELPFTASELKEKYEDKLPKEVSGPTYEVLGKVMKVIINQEYDSNPGTSDSEDGSDASDASEKKEKKEKKKLKSAKTVSEKPRKPRKPKKQRDENKPKRPATAFMIWLNATREKIKSENPKIAVTEIAKKGGEMWRELKDKSEWEEKAAKLKKEYAEAMKEYEATNKNKPDKKESKKETKKESKKDSKKGTKKESEVSPTKSGSFKSKEYISDDNSSDDNEEDKKSESEEEKKPQKKGGKRAATVDKKKVKKGKKEKSPSSSELEAEDSDDASSDDKSS